MEATNFFKDLHRMCITYSRCERAPYEEVPEN